MNPAHVLLQKELKVYFKTFYTEFTYVILFPILLVGTMGLGLSGNTIEVAQYGSYEYIVYIMPGITMMSVLTTAFFNTGFIMLFEKEYADSFEGLVTCPISSGQIVFGKILSGTIKSVLNGIIIIIILVLLTGFSIAPLAILMLPLLLVSALVFSAMGLAMGVVLRKGYQLGTLGNLVILPPTFMGGIFFDVNTLPSGLAAISRASPVTMMVEASKKVMLYGEANIFYELAVISVTFLLFYYIALYMFEKVIFY